MADGQGARRPSRLSNLREILPMIPCSCNRYCNISSLYLRAFLRRACAYTIDTCAGASCVAQLRDHLLPAVLAYRSRKALFKKVAHDPIVHEA